MKKLIALCAAVLLSAGLAGCVGGNPPPAPTESQPAATDAPLTDKQKHIAEDAQKAIDEGAYSEDGLMQFLMADEGYSAEDVMAAVRSIACGLDFNAEAEQKAKTYALTDPEQVKSELRDDGFTEEQAQFGAYPVPQ